MTLQAQERYATQQVRLQALADRMHHNLAETTDLDGLDKLIEALTRVLFHGDKIAVQSAQAAARAERQRHSDFDRAQQEKAQEMIVREKDLRTRAEADPRLQLVDLRGDGVLTLAEQGPPGGHTAAAGAPEAVADSADKHLIASPPLEAGHGSTPGIVMNKESEEAQDQRREQEQAERSEADTQGEALQTAGRGESDLRPPGEGDDGPAEKTEGAATSAELVAEHQQEQHDTERGAQGEEPHEGVETPGASNETLIVKQTPPIAKPGRKRGYQAKADRE